MDRLIGNVVDRYKVVELLGEGAFGRVYRASHVVLHRDVALKLLSPDLQRDQTFSQRFKREAELASLIKDEHVVEVIDFGVSTEGASFLVMELVAGRSLSDVIAEGPIDAARVRELVRQIASGLRAIHARGLVHRDLKPANIRVTNDGGRERVKILDFGIARALDRAGAEKLTQTGATVGTPLYMAPEQIDGSDVETSADVYALGVIAYEMLAGKPPFVGTPARVLYERVAKSPPPLETTSALEPIVFAMLAREPEKRPDAAQLIEMLDAIDMFAEPTARIGPRGARPITDDVTFTVYRPKQIAPETWETLVAFAHLGAPREGSADDPLEEVKRQAEQVLGEQLAEYRESSQDATLPVPKEGELTFVPQIAGVVFNPPKRSFLWLEDVHRETFRMKASRALAGKTARGRLTVMLGNVLIGEVPLAFKVEGAGAAVAESRERVSASTFRRIFMAYADEDRELVAQLEGYASMLGDRLVRGTIAAIDGADVFQLFWSTHAMSSPRVLAEMNHALALGRDGFVRPVHWEVPIPRDPARALPPAELLHVPWTRLGGGASDDVEASADTLLSAKTEPVLEKPPIEKPTRSMLSAISKIAGLAMVCLVAAVTMIPLSRSPDVESIPIPVSIPPPRAVQADPSPPPPPPPWRDPSELDRRLTVEASVKARKQSVASSPILSIVSTPPGALVLIDGVVSGKTPLILPQSYEAKIVLMIELRLDGHKPWKKQVTTNEHGHFSVNVKLERAP